MAESNARSRWRRRWSRQIGPPLVCGLFALIGLYLVVVGVVGVR